MSIIVEHCQSVKNILYKIQKNIIKLFKHPNDEVAHYFELPWIC